MAHRSTSFTPPGSLRSGPAASGGRLGLGPLEATLTDAGAWTRADTAAVAGAGAALAVFYLAPWPVLALLACAVFFAVALRWPLAGVLWVLWTAPWYRFPKVFDAAALGPLAGGRSAAFEVSVVETALLLTGAAWLTGALFPKRGTLRSAAWWRAALASPLGFLVLTAFISLPTTENLHVALRELRTVIIEPAVFALVLRDLLRGERERWAFTHGLVLLAAFVGTQGVVRYLTHTEVTEAEGVWRAGAIYWSPNHLALLLDRLAPVAAALALFAPASRRLRGLYWYATAMTTLTMLLTFSRAGWLALGAVFLVLAAVRHRRALLALAGALAAGASAALALVPLPRLLSAATSSERVWLWQASLAMLRDHPLTGVGLDNFLYVYPRYMLPEAWREPDLSHPHNLVLDFWLRLGILGTFALAWMLGSFVSRTITVLRQGARWARAVGLGLAAALAASVLHGLVDNSFFLIDLAYLFWALWMLQDSFARAALNPPDPAISGIRETP